MCLIFAEFQHSIAGPGGERDVAIDLTESILPTPFSTVGVIGDGVMTVNSDSNSKAIVTLQYDGSDPGGFLTNAEGLGGIDLTDAAGGGDLNNVFLLTFDSIGAGIGPVADGFLDIAVELHSPGGGVASFEGVLDETESPAAYIVDFADFDLSGGFTFTDVTSIQLFFNDSIDFGPFQGVDFVISEVSVTYVPEPSTWTLAAISLIGLIAIRRKKKS